MKIVVSGTRWGTKDEDALKEILLGIAGTHKNVHLIHGGCKGIDMQCDKIAQAEGWKITVVPANWKKYKLKAGPLRNQEMIKTHKPNYIVCFPHKTMKSNGTRSTIAFAKSWIKTNANCALVVETVQ